RNLQQWRIVKQFISSKHLSLYKNKKTSRTVREVFSYSAKCKSSAKSGHDILKTKGVFSSKTLDLIIGTSKKKSTESFVKDIRKNTRRIFTAEQKILIVMEGLRAETSVAELCRKHSIAQSQFYAWNKEFMEAGKKRLNGEVTREATSDEVSELKKENARLKEMVADLVLRYDIVKKVWTCWINP